MDRKKELVIAALLTSSNVREAAKAARISERTLWRWLSDPDFMENFRAAKAGILHESMNTLRQGCQAAASALVSIASDTDAPVAARVTAARSVLEFNLTAHAMESEMENEIRLKRLEHIIKKSKRWRLPCGTA